jgi:DNA topoisomerase VI subunit B
MTIAASSGDIQADGNGRPEKVENRDPAQAFSPAARVTFLTSRDLDFLSPERLVTQTGHPAVEWPRVVVKELVDNALDACEEAGVAPVIEVRADAGGIGVQDNGPGLPEETINGVKDFRVRASSREAYCAPDRGAQGNALKTLLTMPRVLDPEHGRLVVCARAKRRVLTCGVDPISQQIGVRDEESAWDDAGGTLVRVEWAERLKDGEAVWPFAGGRPAAFFEDHVRELVTGFAVFNPHLAVRLNWFGRVTAFRPTDAAWEKWRPCQATSPHWYEPRHLERLVGAFITRDRGRQEDRLVSEFLACFDGLKTSAKRAKVLAETGQARARLSDLVAGDRLDSARIARLLEAMKGNTRAVRPDRLGLLGERHLRARLEAMGILPASFRYSKRLSKSGLPGVVESAFGWLGLDAEDSRRIYTGVNWSAAIGNPFRSFGTTGEGLETYLAHRRATAGEPVVFVLHLAQPRVEYRDHGKSAVVVALPEGQGAA